MEPNPSNPNVVTITADEAADRIRQSGILYEAGVVPPEQRHRANFVWRVCEILGLDPTAESFTRVEAMMERLEIVPHIGNEYPKWVKTGRKEQVYDVNTDSYVDGKKDEMVVVHNADEEAHAGDVVHVGDAIQEAPQPRVEVPTSGLIPAKPSAGTASAPADAKTGFVSAGQGKLLHNDDESAAKKQAEADHKAQAEADRKAQADHKAHPAAPQRNR